MDFGLRIVDRYIGKEIIMTWAAVMFVLLLVIMSAELVRQLSWLAEGRIGADSLLPLFLNSLAKNSIQLMPLTLLLAILFGFGRLYKDSEMAALMSAAMGPVEWYRPVIMIALPGALVLLLLSLFVVPELYFNKTRILDEAGSRSDLSSMMVGRFNASDSGAAVFFQESKSAQGNASRGIFFHQVKEGTQMLDIAATAQNVRDETSDRFLVMNDGRQYLGRAGEADFRIIEYEEYGIRLPDNDSTPDRGLKSMPSQELWGAQGPKSQAELHWRLTLPLAMFMLAIIAVPLSYAKPRSGRYGNIALALFIYLLYQNLLGLCKRWIEGGSIGVWPGSWWVHAIALILAATLLWRQGFLFFRTPGRHS